MPTHCLSDCVTIGRGTLLYLRNARLGWERKTRRTALAPQMPPSSANRERFTCGFVSLKGTKTTYAYMVSSKKCGEGDGGTNPNEAYSPKTRGWCDLGALSCARKKLYRDEQKRPVIVHGYIVYNADMESRWPPCREYRQSRRRS